MSAECRVRVTGRALSSLGTFTFTWHFNIVHQVADFLKALGEGTPCHPTFRDALETQYVCDAVLKSAKTRGWETVKHA